MTVQPASARIASLDQFRGFAVLAMFVVNFLGHLAVTPALLKHNNTYFSLADWIMPGFLFACGFSFRLVSVRRRDSDGRSGAARRYLSRSLGLILLSVMLFGFGSDFTSASEMTGDNIRRFLSGWIKAGLWEVLAIIGAVQILILPVIDAGGRVRTAALAGLAVVHCLLSWSFNYEFVYGRPTWMDAYFGGAGKRCWDGGIFGLISWTEVMLIGTLARDVWKADRLGATLVKLTGWSCLLMAAGYGLSCLTRLYDIDVSAGPDAVADSRSASPVLPQFARMRGRPWRSMLAEPPLFAPPGPEKRQPNYWVMDKRVVTQSFVLFSSGFAMLVFTAFVAGCDVARIELPVLRSFGKNPLAAYVIHHFVSHTVLSIVPPDSPGMWAVAGLLAFTGITWMFVVFLENRSVFLRL